MTLAPMLAKLGDVNAIAVGVFAVFVLSVIWLSFHLGKKAKSAKGYFAAGGQISWQVNGISFAGDYLSAASFLGICGLIATVGYDGFLYSIGYLAGWVVALFVVAEPLKRLGKYTFTDALDAKFDSRGIKLAAAISTLVVSVFYLIPQMVGAGTLVTPLLGLPHWVGVVMVGAIVITIVAKAGMASTTYVQFIKGSLLIVFSTVLVIAVCIRGLSTDVEKGGIDGEFAFVPRIIDNAQTDSAGRFVVGQQIDDVYAAEGADGDVAIRGTLLGQATGASSQASYDKARATDPNAEIPPPQTYVQIDEDGGRMTWWKVEASVEGSTLVECQWMQDRDGVLWVNGAEAPGGVNDLELTGRLLQLADMDEAEAREGTGPLNPLGFIAKLGHEDTLFEQWRNDRVVGQGDEYTLSYRSIRRGSDMMKPGVRFKTKSLWEKLNFISLMLALFCGTAALPHILIRYYTVRSPADARKSTILAIGAIGFFYILTLFMGLGAAVNGVMIPAAGKGNMAAPLLANSFGALLFAVISAIAFATVLGTVSGLIVASSGAVAHDLMDRFGQMNMTEKSKVYAGKVAAFAVGIVAIVLGIVFENFNVSFLVGWAFAVAASANLPAIVMLLFWKRTTARGIVASITVGIISALGIILTGPDVFAKLYGLPSADAFHQLGQPGIISIPLSFVTLVVVSLMTKRKVVPAHA